ncbi:hypothetical protein [Nodosilinea sp. P-1105]|uniref:hypothetical protein n=1 Tax=Nodosilinea sp. P-1105 TaxID=2546229 RepID=UPI00146E89DB|nr:hypothetical protein [Nodosilinea sp. P-1105]NMF85264.1 hypothetical protein [Nodosilinea sp. P-1105]
MVKIQATSIVLATLAIAQGGASVARPHVPSTLSRSGCFTWAETPLPPAVLDTIALPLTRDWQNHLSDPTGLFLGVNEGSQFSPGTVFSPLEQPAGRLFNLETANQLPGEALQLTVGVHSTLFDTQPGTGNQVFYGDVEWGISDRLQLALTYQNYDDPPTQPINGDSPNITLLSLAPSVKYRIVKTERLALAIQGSAEWLSFLSPLFDSDDQGGRHLMGSLHLPTTYTISPGLQFHLTPSVSFFPSSINGLAFYDTLFSLGAGASWQASERWLSYGTLHWPIGPGGNAIQTDQSIGRQLLWTLGSRYTITPKVGVNLYATNGLGVTPATRILASIPGGNQPRLGLQLHYTPDLGSGYRSSYRDPMLTSLSDRDRQQGLNGFTLTTAHTLEPGQVALTVGGGTNSNYSIGLAYSPDHALQLEAMLEDFGSDDSVSAADTAGTAVRYMAGAKLQLFDQRQGDPVSLGVRLLAGRDIDQAGSTGVWNLDVPLTYSVNAQTALWVNPRLAAFGNTLTTGLGVGLNYHLTQDWQLLGEVTPVFGDGQLVWALGSRYRLPNTAVYIDLYGTNAVGRQGLGTLVGQSGGRLGAAFNWLVGR